MSDRLDQLLEQARVPEPSDDGFTELVMQAIRAPKATRRFRGRFVMRPAVLAAAAVLATGGALAAAVTTTTKPTNNASSTALPATAKPATAASRQTPAATSRGHGTVVIASPATSATHASAKPVVQTFHNASYEWGYTTSHTSFVLDKRTGLKVVMDTRGVSLSAGHAHEVIVTVVNTSTSPMGISSQNGCAVSAAAWRGKAPDASTSPAAGRDPAKANIWRCPDGTDAHSGAGEQFLLGPGGVRKETVSLKLPSGDWTMAGACRCDVVTAIDPGSGMTLHGVDSVVTGQAAGTTPGLLTPPIGVESR